MDSIGLIGQLDLVLKIVFGYSLHGNNILSDPSVSKKSSIFNQTRSCTGVDL